MKRSTMARTARAYSLKSTARPTAPKLGRSKSKRAHAGEIESATGVEMMHISQSLVPLLLHIVRRCSLFPVIPVANAGGAIKKAPAWLKDGA
jgi:hypothetical protein